ncbi:DUF4038 domain-containing protein [Marispirochaeta aestuarii]|uniref:apiosidase-like domain-containing protein n=1 Tax=Marispirochaeta aestuarii TaxID=1963862 RepID=UPI002ABE3DB0|nr:DUF4038 domain-containing protein [Marispirochaeta aestuarii]
MPQIHIWERHEIVLQAEKEYRNPYMEVDMGVHLRGPGFNKRVYGFWDGGNTFKIRLTATKPGTWTWESFANVDDPGLMGKSGSYTAVEWTEEEKRENVCRRGFPRPTANRHAFEMPDGTPFFWLADMWLAAATNHYPWREDDRSYPIGPDAGFKDMIRYRRDQGYNGITMIACFPAWGIDRLPAWAYMEDGLVIRHSWMEHGNNLEPDGSKCRSTDMHNEGGRPFEFPGPVPGYEDIVPDMTKINPEYFRYLDKRIDYCNENGIIPFLELWRRDFSEVWSKYCGWPETYIKYTSYMYARYHANNVFLSPIHMDTPEDSIPPREYNKPIRMYFARYGRPPFGTMISTNAAPSTLVNYGNVEWIDFHQIGNKWREHVSFWYLKELYWNKPERPALNGEPYTPGFPPETDLEMFSEEAYRNTRSGMYGSVLSGGQSGYVHELQAMYDGCRSPEAVYRMWDVFDIATSHQAVYLKNFVMSLEGRHVELIPDSECIIPNKSGDEFGWTGWAYCAYTPERDIILAYFEEGTPRKANLFRGGAYGCRYKLVWYNPRTGEWLDRNEVVEPDVRGVLEIPELPDDRDWALKMEIL